MVKYDILLIGDGTNLLRTIGWVLEYKGFAVKATTSPEAALEALVKKNYDMVIAKPATDNVDGLDILKRAKRLNPDIKVVVLSGNNDMIFPIEAYQVEVDDYILMPVSPTELWRRVSQCLEDREVVDLQPVRVPDESVSDGYNVKAKLTEASNRLDNLIQLTEDFIRKALTDYRPAGREWDLLDLKGDIVEPVLAELAPEIRDQKITLVNRLHSQQEGKVPVKGSKLWLKSVFRNLINNGIKYGGQGCTIMIDFEMHGSNCRLNIYNSGKEVPEEYRSMLFKTAPGLRRSKKYPRRGLGLGLSLSHDIMQNQGGDIWYEAKTEGSNFVMSLPQY
jgi:CheY-like chemotaxis protein